MKRPRKRHVNGRHVVVCALAITALLAVVLLQTGCTQTQRLPQIEHTVKQFWLGMPGTVPQMALDHDLPRTEVDLRSLVNAFNLSTVEPWDHQNPTIPSMLVLLVLEDDTEVWMAFNGQFGASHAELAIRRVQDGQPGQFEQYWVRSSALVTQAAALGLDMLSVSEMGLVDPEGTWLLR